MFIIKWVLLLAWAFVGMFVLPIKWAGLNNTAFVLSNFAVTYAMILTIVVFFLGASRLKES